MSDRTAGGLASLLRVLHVLVALSAYFASTRDCPLAAEPHPAAALKVAVYDLPPYGAAESDGAISGVSVDLWRRVAEELQWEYKLIPVSHMESILSGLEQGSFDAGIGAITITPEREARVDFSYPAHRSGVAVALPSETGPFAAVVSYWRVAADLGSLLVGMLALLLLLGTLIWLVERPGLAGKEAQEETWPLCVTDSIGRSSRRRLSVMGTRRRRLLLAA